MYRIYYEAIFPQIHVDLWRFNKVIFDQCECKKRVTQNTAKRTSITDIISYVLYISIFYLNYQIKIKLFICQGTVCLLKITRRKRKREF